MLSNLSKGEIDHYLYLVAKEYKKINRNNPECEFILVGGSSVVVNYGFRDTTTDIDGIILANSNMRDAINKVGDDNDLGRGWLNDDFKRTNSYSPKLEEYSKFYKKFYSCLNVRIIEGEYLIAMKFRSGRDYKSDYSDIVGILKESIEKENPLNLEKIETAYINLYEESLPESDKEFFVKLTKNEDLEQFYYDITKKERNNRDKLLHAEEKYGKLSNKQISEFVSSIEENKSVETDRVTSDDYDPRTDDEHER